LSVLARQAGQAIVGEATLSVAIGSARFPVDGEDAERLIAVADQRMYQMKAAMKTAPEAAMPARRETQIAASPFVH
jgi:predicted signal transduction protein with EAL and GGDEF domain